MKILGKEIDTINYRMNEENLDREDGKRIWRHFQRFAEYNDLKDLYQKCIPQLALFEQNMVDQANKIEQFNHILLRFDKNLAKKADKTAINHFQQEVTNLYVKKDVLPGVNQKIKNVNKQQTNNYDEMNNLLKNVT